MRTLRLKAERLALLTLALVLYPIGMPRYWLLQFAQDAASRLAQFGYWLYRQGTDKEMAMRELGDKMDIPIQSMELSGVRKWHLARLNAIHAELHKDRVVH